MWVCFVLWFFLRMLIHPEWSEIIYMYFDFVIHRAHHWIKIWDILVMNTHVHAHPQAFFVYTLQAISTLPRTPASSWYVQTQCRQTHSLINHFDPLMRYFFHQHPCSSPSPGINHLAWVISTLPKPSMCSPNTLFASVNMIWWYQACSSRRKLSNPKPKLKSKELNDQKWM